MELIIISILVYLEVKLLQLEFGGSTYNNLVDENTTFLLMKIGSLGMVFRDLFLEVRSENNC
jgi:hypothetical protein